MDNSNILSSFERFEKLFFFSEVKIELLLWERSFSTVSIVGCLFLRGPFTRCSTADFHHINILYIPLPIWRAHVEILRP